MTDERYEELLAFLRERSPSPEAFALAPSILGIPLIVDDEVETVVLSERPEVRMSHEDYMDLNRRLDMKPPS